MADSWTHGVLLALLAWIDTRTGYPERALRTVGDVQNVAHGPEIGPSDLAALHIATAAVVTLGTQPLAEVLSPVWRAFGQAHDETTGG